jgi:clorobiocin biosynthesis protein CloN5
MSAESAETIEALRAFIERRNLDGRATLSEDTPLLEWGVLDSLGLAELTAFVEERFGLAVPIEAITPDNFRDLRAIAALLRDLADGAAVDGRP